MSDDIKAFEGIKPIRVGNYTVSDAEQLVLAGIALAVLAANWRQNPPGVIAWSQTTPESSLRRY